MPVYLFTIVLKDSASGRQVKEGVREYKSPDLDRVYQGGEGSLVEARGKRKGEVDRTWGERIWGRPKMGRWSS